MNAFTGSRTFLKGERVLQGILLQVNRDIPFFQKVLDIIVCGQVITTDELYALAQQRNGTTNLLTSANRMASMLKVKLIRNTGEEIWESFLLIIYFGISTQSLVVNQNNTKKCVNMAENFKIHVEDSHSAQLLLERIVKSVTVLKEVSIRIPRIYIFSLFPLNAPIFPDI